MAAATNQDFVTYRGNDVAPVFTVLNSAGDVVDISGVTQITWSAQRDEASAAVVTKTKTAGQITFVTDGTDGQFQVAITDADTSALTGFYIHTASIADSVGNIGTVTVGRMQVGIAPSWSYDVTQLATSSMYQVRRFIGDVLVGEQQMADAEILFALDLYPNTYLAAAECCRQLSAQFARKVDIVIGTLKTNYSSMSKRYADMAVELEQRGMQTAGANMIYAGGITTADKAAQVANTELVQPSFNIGMDDNLTPPGPYRPQVPSSGVS